MSPAAPDPRATAPMDGPTISTLCLAVDVGGTKLAAGLVGRRGEVVWQTRSATPAGGDADALFATLADVVDRALAARPPQAAVVVCGVGCGGPMSAGGETVSPLNIPAWRDFPLRSRLAAHTGLPTVVDNDAKALALGEGWQGAARGVPDFVAMVVSTGVGGGIVLDGRLLQGTGGNAGHIGHVIVEPEGRLCGCGGRGCLEAEASGLAITAITGHPPSQAPPEVVARTGMLVGRALSSVANLLDLELAVVAGSVSLGFGQPFFTAAQAELTARAKLSFSRRSLVVPAGLGADGPLVGAAAVGWRHLGDEVLSPVSLRARP